MGGGDSPEGIFLVPLKTQYFHTKLPCEKLMLKQTEWRVEKLTFQKEGSITTNPLYFLKI